MPMYRIITDIVDEEDLDPEVARVMGNDYIEALFSQRLSDLYEDLYRDHTEEEIEEMAIAEVEDSVNEAIERVKRLTNKTIVYRTIALPRSADPTRIENIGQSWSTEPEYARNYIPMERLGIEDPVLWRYKAYVNPAAVDRDGTIEANVGGEMNEILSDANEIQFGSGKPIRVLEVGRIDADPEWFYTMQDAVSLTGEYSWDDPEWWAGRETELIPIDAWRLT